ncbi:ABC transporter ATP-binding protein, partial [Streptomyces sp. adm13(2018)]|uniref:ABC transporter ATP-binding protein n=1 Tax=Streptomyces sp. adm13(2018) TaxID=2479007 RepID=UPI0013A42CBA
LDFTVPAGRITGLLGPSGCGKTTLMRAIVGTQAKVGGTLQVLGHPAGDPALRARIGYVTQAPSVYDDLTVRQNLDYFAAVLHPGPTHRHDRHDLVDRAVADVDLTAHADSLAGRLSGGQRSRVSLAVALLGTPDLLVLDEPTVGLDPVLRRDLWELFHRIAAEDLLGVGEVRGGGVAAGRDHGHALVDEDGGVGHDADDGGALMREGEILADDTPEALRRRNDTPTVEEAFLRLVDAAATRAAHEEPRS